MTRLFNFLPTKPLLMRQHLSAAFVAAGILVSPYVALAAPDVVACDLLDESTVSGLIGVKTKQFMNRDKQTYDGVKISSCIYRAERHSVMVTLAEYSSNSEATKAYAIALKEAGQAKVVDKTTIRYKVESESGIGDKAYWYQLESEQFGVSAIKGTRGIMVNFQFSDSMSGVNAGARLKERSRPAIQAAIQKL